MSVSRSASNEIVHAATQRGYIVIAISGEPRRCWGATLQATVNGKATYWGLSALSKASLLSQIGEMPISDARERGQR